MPTLLRQGSRGFDVVVLQVQLNAKGAQPRLKVDGDFGPRTQAAVLAFQRQNRLSADGVAGPITQAALAQGLNIASANHNLTHIPQPTPSTCWAASTAMLTRSTVPAVIARTPRDMVSADGGLNNGSATDLGAPLGARFAAAHGLRCNPPMSWSVGALVNTLKRTPLIFSMLWRAQDYAAGRGSPGHWVAVSAMVSDNQPTGEGTHLLVLDPWPPNRGKISWVEYQAWVMDVPTRTYRVFER